MKLKLINEFSEQFKIAIAERKFTPDSLFRRCIADWQEHFSFDKLDLSECLDKALKNDISGRYWDGERHSVKSGLMLLAKSAPDLFYESLKDLFNSDKLLEMRVNRFLYHCDEILRFKQLQDKKLNTHYQNIYSTSLLLSLENPSEYCLYNFDLFTAFAKAIGVINIPAHNDIDRYYKILRSTYKLLAKDESLMNIYYEKLEPDVYLGPSLMVAYDFMRFVNT